MCLQQILFLLFVLPMSAILTQYTITGYDASAHLSEETQGAADGAAKGIWRSIFYSAIGGYVLLLSFLLPHTGSARGFDALHQRLRQNTAQRASDAIAQVLGR